MSIIDICMIVGYFAVLMVLGVVAGKENNNSDDYFLAGRSMPWLPVALSVAATMISANGLIGGPGWAYNSGMFPMMTNIAVPLAVFIAMYITTPIFYSLKITSIYEYMSLRFGNFTRMLTVTQFFVNSVIQASSMIYLPCLLISSITNISVAQIVPVIVIIATLYTITGGIKAVIYTDALQMFVIVGSVILIVSTICSGLNMSIVEIFISAGEAGKLNSLSFSFDISNNQAFWVTLIGGTVMWVRYFCFDQAQVQRVLTAKSINDTKKSLATSAIIMNIVYSSMLMIGCFLFIFYDGKEFTSENDIMIDFMLNQLPVGAVGLVIAGVFAGSMSSVDSLLNSMSVVFTKDIWEYYFKKESNIKIEKYITCFIGILIAIFVVLGFSSTTQSIVNVVGSYISYFSGPAIGAFLLALFTKKTTDKGVASGFLVGVVFGVLIASIFNIGWLWNPFIGLVITVIFALLLSPLDKEGLKEIEVKKEYTAEFIIKKYNTNKDMFVFGKYEKIVLSFFILQYVVLGFIEIMF